MNFPLASKILLICAAVCALLCPSPSGAWAQSCSGGQFQPSHIVDLANSSPFAPELYVRCEMNAGDDCTALAPQAGSQSSYASTVATAINNGPASLRNQLCTLSYIYIDPAGTNTAWGLRDFTTDATNGRSYTGQHIGISRQLLQYLSPLSAPFATYENFITRILLTPSSTQIPPPPPLADTTTAWIQGVTYSGTLNDNMSTAILGILAHEMGHIIYVTQVKNQIMTAPPCNIQGVKRAFHKYSWNESGHNFGFHRFGGVDTQHRPTASKTLLEITSLLQANDVVHAGNFLQQIYNGHEWASLFATVAVDEDFVETYMLHQLNAGNVLSTFPVTIPAAPGTTTPIGTFDVMSGFGNSYSKLAQKASWIDQCIQ